MPITLQYNWDLILYVRLEVFDGKNRIFVILVPSQYLEEGLVKKGS